MLLINLTTAIIIVNVANIKRPLSLQMHSVTLFDSSNLDGVGVEWSGGQYRDYDDC